MGLAVQLYEATRHYPVEERYGLVVQTRRAAVSVAANIAEGHARPRGAYVNHLSIALGSLAELETLVILGYRLGYLTSAQLKECVNSLKATGRCCQALHNSLRPNP